MTLPSHLSTHEAQGLKEGEPLAQYEIGDARNFNYLVIDWKSRRAALVDPHSGLSPILKDLEAHSLTLEEVWLTHSHWDHVAGLPELAHAQPEITIRVHLEDQHRLEKWKKQFPQANLVSLHDGEILNLGSPAVSVKVMHTPGHSAGECSYFITSLQSVGQNTLQNSAPYFLLTGDTLFIRDCGRTDFKDGSNEAMFESLQKISRLPPETVILPGHHYQNECASTLARELETSPPLRCRSVEELAALP